MFLLLLDDGLDLGFSAPVSLSQFLKENKIVYL